MTETKQKTINYVLVVDEMRNRILHELLMAISNNQETVTLFSLLLVKKGVDLSEFSKFVNEVAEKEHELGWCNDPKCSYKK